MYSSIDVSPLVADCLDLAMERADEICSSRNIELAADWVALVAVQMQAHAVLHAGEAMSKALNELAAGNRELLGGMRGMEEALRTFQSRKGKPCRSGL